MSKPLFNFDLEFRLGIEAIDAEHAKLVDMLNRTHDLLGEGKRDEARVYFGQTLSAYVNEHFANEERFMESIGYPALEEHRKIHENFRRSFQELAPTIESFDEAAFRKSLSDAFTWIINHIGRTDKKYATFYLSQK